MPEKLTLDSIRQRKDEAGEVLRASLHGGKKVALDHELILPPSPRSDSWGVLADRMAGWYANVDGRLDAGETALFSTQLKYVLAEYMRTMYPANLVRSWGFRIDRDIPPGAKTVAVRRVEAKGQMRLAGSISNDAPLLSIQAHEDVHRIGEYIGAAEWSISQLEAAAFAGFPLEMESLEALALIAEENFEDVAASGESTMGVYGLLNESNIPLVTATTGTWSTPATAAQILADLQKLLYTVEANVKDISILFPRLLVIPSSLRKYLAFRQTYTDKTVRELLIEEFPGLQIVFWTKSDLADAAGTGPRILAACTHPSAGRILEPLPFMMLAPQQQDVVFRAIGRQKLGGLALQHPYAFGHMDGC